MAHYANALSFLLFIVLFLSLQLEARESKFFTKVVIHNNSNTTTNTVHQVETPSQSPIPSPLATPLPAPAPAPELVQSENGYGLYGKDSDEFPPAKTSTTTTTTTFENEESEFSAEEFSEESNKELYNNNNHDSKNGYPSNYNENAYVTEPQGLSDTKFLDNGKYFYDTKYPPTTTSTAAISNEENEFPAEEEPSSESNREYNYEKNYESKNGYPSNYNENAYVTEPQGMSDTRYLENGKYYDDHKNERYYDPVKGNGNNNKGYYGNGDMTKYEFDSMEEYDKQERYRQSQEEYVP